MKDDLLNVSDCEQLHHSEKVWGSPLLLIIDGDDVVFVDSCRDENISKPF